jgi:dTDP-4-amino-4,6-dideoxygalactose transaminase
MTKLAIDGGPKEISDAFKFPGWPIVNDEDIAAFTRVINKKDFYGKYNDEVVQLEKEYSEYAGTKYCLALNSGTAALHASIAGVGIEPGDEVLVPSLTFLASATSVLHHNAIPIFVDIDTETFNIDPDKIEKSITEKTKAIMPVDYHGLPADYDKIYKIAKKHNLVVIEDGSQAAGAEYQGKKVGSLGDICGMSIMPLKALPGGGDGGLICTNNETYRDLADMIRMFGEVLSKGQDREYNAYTMGWNYRISPFTAAMARSQLKRLNDNMEARREKAAYISKALGEIPGIIPPYVPNDRSHSYYIYYLKLDPEAAGLDISPGRFRQAIQDILRAEGVPVNISQRTPIPGQALFQVKRGYGKGCPWSCKYGRDISYDIKDYPQTLDVLERSLALDVGFIHPLTSRDVQKKLLNAFYKVFDNLEAVLKYARNIDYKSPWETFSELPPLVQASEYVSESLGASFINRKGITTYTNG